MYTLLKGIGIGFCAAAPVGPVAVICIRRTLAYGRISGIASGIGAATADLFYATLASLGFVAVSDYLISHHFFIRFFGGILIFSIGARTIRKKQAISEKAISAKTIIASYLSTLLLTLANPLIILVFIAIFSALCPARETIATTIILVSGIFIGSCTWFIVLSETMYTLRSKFTNRFVTIMNNISGIILMIFGLLTFASAFFPRCFII